jgi:predicted phage tail protein
MLRKIKLYGKLAKFIGHRVLEADVATAAEAVRFLLANWPELEAHMSDQHYRVSVGTYDLMAEELHDPAGAAPISFVPVVMAGAGGSLGKILIGIALIAASFLLPGAGAFGTFSIFGQAAVAGGFATGIATTLSLVGASLILGGVAQLLTPTPKSAKAQIVKTTHARATASAAFRTPAARCASANRLRRNLVGSVVISAGIDTVQVYANGRIYGAGAGGMGWWRWRPHTFHGRRQS